MNKKEPIKHSMKKLNGKMEVEPEESFDVKSLDKPMWTTDKEKWLLERCNNFERKIDELSKKIEKQNTVIGKNASLLEELVKKIRLPANEDSPSTLKLPTERDSNDEDLKIFPIKSLTELESIDSKTKDVPEADIIAYIKNYIGDSSIKKSVKTFFDESLIVKVNWSGARGMVAVKNFKLFSTFVFDAVKTPESSYTQYISDIKEGFRNAKINYRKKHLIKKAELGKKIEKQNTVIRKNASLLEEPVKKIRLTANEDSPSTLKLPTERDSNYEDLKIFPIKSLTELESIDSKTKDVPEADIIAYIKNYIGDSSIKKSVQKFFDESLIVQVNWSGARGMVAVKNFKLFSTFVFDAVKTPESSYTQYISDIKEGFRNAKINYRKKHLIKKAELGKKIEKQNTVIRKNASLLEEPVKKIRLTANEDSPSTLKLPTERDSNYEDLKIFPIKSLTELESIDSKTKDVPEADIIAYIKNYIGDSSIKKSVQKFFDESLIVQVNWSGARGMVAVKNFKLFSTFVFDAVKTPDSSYTQYISDIKEGFHNAKINYRNKHIIKKDNRITAESSEIVAPVETPIASTDTVAHESPISQIFPIKSLKALEEIDRSIQAHAISEVDIALYIRDVLQVDADNIKEIVNQLFDESILLKISWNGKRNKVPIKNLKLFNTYLFEAVRTPDMTYSHYISQIKIGFQWTKRRIYRITQKLSKKKKKLEESVKKAKQKPTKNGILLDTLNEDPYQNCYEPKIEIYSENEMKQQSDIANSCVPLDQTSKSFDTTNMEHFENQETSYSVFSENEDSKLYQKFDVSKIFPIKSYRALERIDRRIQSIPEADLIDYIRQAVGSASIKESIQIFFGESLVTQINWNGTNKMKPLKHIKLFNTYVFEAIKTPKYQYDQYISEINKGLLIVKKKLSKERKSLKTDENEESYDEEELSDPIYNSTTYQEDVLHSAILRIFPIRTLDQLYKADDDVLGIPDEDIIKHIKGIIGNMELKSCLQYLFDDSIILEINWNGRFNKIAAKNFKLFNTYLFEAVRTPKFGYKEYAEEMKKGFLRAKSRSYNRTSQQKSR